ncbi:MAG: peroxiredoxin-like family protein [Crocinitomicaceae bacterium]
MKLTYTCLLALTAIFIGCNSTQPSNHKQEILSEVSEDINMKEEKISTLKSVLDAKKAKFEEVASDEKKEKYAAGIQSVVDNRVVDSAFQIGDTAPDFSLTSAKGEQVSLYAELENGPIILMWYRGGWCPYCNMTLNAMQGSLSAFKKYGANLLALTPELPDSSISTSEKNNLDFQILSDIDNQVAKQYNLVFKLTNDVGDLYENGFGLSQYNGSTSNELPLAATYIIGKDKIIKFAFLDADYRNRAEPSDLIKALKKLKNEK